VRKLFLTSAMIVLLGTASIAPASAQDLRLTGSGASFPFPLYSSWFKDFSKQTQGVTVDYQAKGSGAGIQDFINNTVDFAASDAAMSDEEIAKIKQGVVLLPMTAGEIVLSYNLEGVKELKLPREVYPDIFAGKITKWNDPKIAAANPGVKLPDQKITVVARSDSSGTTYVFTGHLSAISEAFKSSRRPRHHRAMAHQLRESAEKRRRDRHHQANAGRHRLYRIHLRHRHQTADGRAAKQGRPIHRSRR
jgi:phosphate transport system substrate-binding protein